MRSSISNNGHEKKRVGIWIRVSTEMQAETDSPEHHEQRAKFYAEAKGWQTVEVYHLEAQSGKSVAGHPETKRMMEDIGRGHISGLIFSKLARLARNTKELLEFADFFQEMNADLISLGESIDTSSPAGRLFYTLIAATTQFEREEIADRVAASVPIRAKLGKSLGGAAPFGYRWDGHNLVPDEREAPVRKLMYELFLKYERKNTVANKLNEMGYRTRKGAKFTFTTVSRLLKDPTAKGIRRANYTKSRGEGKHWDLKPKKDWVEIPIEPIISQELWNEVNCILERNRRTRKSPGKRAVHLFSGVTFCHCGRKMYVPSNTPKYVCQTCRNKIRKIDLEEIFHIQLREFYFSPDEILSYLKSADSGIKEKEELLSSLKIEKKKTKAEMDKIYGLYMNDKISSDGFAENYRPLENRLKEISDQIPDLQGEVDFLKIQYISRDEILSEARNLYDRWKTLTRDEKRNIIEQTVERIVIGEKEIDIELGYMPSSSEMMANNQRNIKDSSKRPL